MNDPLPAQLAPPEEKGPPPNGVLIVDKPQGPTSHDIVARARRYFGTKRVGHAGTLDPMASGVLLILLGEATKLSGALTLDQKTYQATVAFGKSTDSDDAQGQVLETVELTPGFLTDDALSEALAVERAKVTQVPPVVTAIKQDGMAAHKRHRQGLTVEVKPRDVQVFDLRVLGRTDTTVELLLTVSKGYYVRSLARDLGAHLGVPSHLASLRRISSGGFHIDEAVTFPPTAGPPKLLSLVDTVKRALPYLRLTVEGVDLARVGKVLGPEHVMEPRERIPTLQTCAWLSPDEQMVALGQFDAEGVGRVQRGFATHQPPTATSAQSLEFV